MSILDYSIVILFLVLTLILGLVFTRKASKSISDYFLSGRSVPWWLAGTSMVATSFASDTPLAITEIFYKEGIAGNWYWWSFAIQNIMVSFLFASLWNKLGLITDAEFFSIRYSGLSSDILRISQAIINGVLVNIITLGWVYLGLSSVIQVIFNVNPVVAVSICLIISISYSMASGLWGVIATDLFQFIIAIIGSVILAIKSVSILGGMNNVINKIIETGNLEKLDFMPQLSSSIFTAVIVYLTLQWWSGSAVDSGGGIIVQRICASKSSKDSILAVFWYNIAHFALRPWPWIITAICAFLIYPQIEEPRLSYVLIMKKALPSGFLGLMVVSFLGAFMSTVDTHFNWGSSYLVNDIYKKYLVKSKSQRHYIFIARLCTFFIAILSVIVALNLNSIVGAWKFLTLLGSGVGLIKILRWLWWRINGWAEIVAMFSSLISSIILMSFTKFQYHTILSLNVIITTVLWIITVYITPKTDEYILKKFAETIKPYPLFWRGLSPGQKKINLKPFLNWLFGVIFVYSLLFTIGAFFLKRFSLFYTTLSVLVIISILIFYLLKEQK